MVSRSGKAAGIFPLYLCYNREDMKRLPILLCLFSLTFAQTPMDTARNVQKALNSLKTMEADFINTHYSSSVSFPDKQTGKIWLKNPDMMKWHYRNPEEKIFLILMVLFFMFTKIRVSHQLRTMRLKTKSTTTIAPIIMMVIRLCSGEDM